MVLLASTTLPNRPSRSQQARRLCAQMRAWVSCSRARWQLRLRHLRLSAASPASISRSPCLLAPSWGTRIAPPLPSPASLRVPSPPTRTPRSPSMLLFNRVLSDPTVVLLLARSRRRSKTHPIPRSLVLSTETPTETLTPVTSGTFSANKEAGSTTLILCCVVYS